MGVSVSPHSPTPEEVAKLRVQHQTIVEFLYEANVLAEPRATRHGVREKVRRLSQMERDALHTRLKRNMDRLDELMATDTKTFENPYVEHADLVSGVRIPNFRE